MNVFNSLGSNYDLSFAIKSLVSKDSNSKIKLIQELEKKYGGKAFLFYKGREAIEIALKSLNLGSDNYVAVNGFTCFAVYKAIENSNLKPILIDIEKNDLNFTPESLKMELQKNGKIKAVIIQNTLGYPCDIEQIYKICKEKKLIVIEDLAHSAGTIYKNGREAGGYGDFVILSFSQDKIIDGISGGALIVKKDNLNLEIKNFKNVNFKNQTKDRLYPLFTFLIRKLYPTFLGKILHKFLRLINILSKPMDDKDKISLLPNWYSSLILHSINNLVENIVHRKKIAEIYSSHLNPDLIIKSVSENINYSTNLRYPILVKERKKIIQELKKIGIYVSDIWYDAPISPKRYMKKIDYKNNCPNSEYVSDMILNLPTHKNITEKNAIRIAEITNKVCKLN